MENKQTTIKDVARLANVSLATVSRVVNGTDNVSQANRIKVEKVIEELGYVPNAAARSLVRMRTNSIGVIVNNLHDPFFHDIIKGFEYAAKETNYNVVFCSVLGGDVESKVNYIKYLSNGVVDAVILFGSYLSDFELIKYLKSAKMNFTLIENDVPGLDCNRLLVDNVGGARKAVEYLYSLGHTRIAHIAGNPNKRVSLDRLNGYFSAMHDNGLDIEENYVQYITKSPDSAKKCMENLINIQQRPTAIFCYDDEVASNIIMVATEYGLNVPEDLSVIGFDSRGILPEYYKGPDITSIKQPLYQIGYDSITLLAEKLSSKKGTENIHKTYDTKVVVKNSCKSIK